MREVTPFLKVAHIIYNLRVKDLEEVGKVASRKLTSGKRNLMLINRDSVLDTIHFMYKDSFNHPSRS